MATIKELGIQIEALGRQESRPESRRGPVVQGTSEWCHCDRGDSCEALLFCIACCDGHMAPRTLRDARFLPPGP